MSATAQATGTLPAIYQQAKMNTTNIILTIIILFGLLAFKKNEVDKKIKQRMFCEAFKNRSTAPNYIVVTVKNLKTNMTKEVCTEAPFLNGAINKETGIFTFGVDCIKYKGMYFEFSKDSALWNIGFDLYSKTELENYSKTLDIDNIILAIKTGKLTNKSFDGDNKEQRMFAHIMFNNGVMVKRGCLVGNISELRYFTTR